MTIIEITSIIIIVLNIIFSLNRNPASNIYALFKVIASYFVSIIFINNLELISLKLTVLNSPNVNEGILFISTFSLIYIFLTVFYFLLKQIIEIKLIPFLTKPLGLIFGLINSIMLIFVIFIAIYHINLPIFNKITAKSLIFENSFIYYNEFINYISAENHLKKWISLKKFN